MLSNINIEVVLIDKEAHKYEKLLTQLSRRLVKFLPQEGEIEIYLVSGRRMRNLNRRFRGKDTSTNVLSFKKPEYFPGDKLGEVYLDPLYIQKHKESIALMLVHGVLHILGYDHQKKGDRIKMEAKEAKLLLKIKA